jgi:hypothetical protein
LCSRWCPPFGFWIEILCCFSISPFLVLYVLPISTLIWNEEHD